jgi:hypothetical protein
MQRCEHRNIKRGHETGGIISVSEQVYSILYAELSRAILYLLAERPIAYQHEVSVRLLPRHASGGFDKEAMAFDTVQSRHDSNNPRALVQPELTAKLVAPLSPGYRSPFPCFSDGAKPVLDDDYLLSMRGYRGSYRLGVHKYSVRKLMDQAGPPFMNAAIRKLQVALAGDYPDGGEAGSNRADDARIEVMSVKDVYPVIQHQSPEPQELL